MIWKTKNQIRLNIYLMKLVTISPYAITRNKYKRIKNSFNDQTSSFRRQTFTRSNSTKKTWYLICSNLLIKILHQCHWRNSSVAVISFRHCILVYLLFIPHAKWCNVHRSRHSKHSTAPYRTVKETISRELSKNYKSTILQKSLWIVTLA